MWHFNESRPMKAHRGQSIPIIFTDIVRKLDNDFFAGRWSRATDRQRDLLCIIAELPSSDKEFTVNEVVEGVEEEDGQAVQPKPRQSDARIALRRGAGL